MRRCNGLTVTTSPRTRAHWDFGIFLFANYIPNTITRIQSSPYPPRGHTNSYAPLGPMIMNLQLLTAQCNTSPAVSRTLSNNAVNSRLMPTALLDAH